jgi:hypothetical protein
LLLIGAEQKSRQRHRPPSTPPALVQFPPICRFPFRKSLLKIPHT